MFTPEKNTTTKKKVPAFYLFLPAGIEYKTQGHNHKVINTSHTTINASNDVGLFHSLYKGSLQKSRRGSTVEQLLVNSTSIIVNLIWPFLKQPIYLGLTRRVHWLVNP